MKKKMFVLIATFLFIPHVNAECDESRLREIKQLADNIEITFEIPISGEEYEPHRDYTVNDYGENIPQGSTQVIISGMSEDLYIMDTTYERTFTYTDFKDNVLILNSEIHGNRTFKVYSKECNEEVKNIYVKVPRYNEYSEDALCEGINEDDLAICGTWYDREVDYDTFKTMVDNYKKSLDTPTETTKDIEKTTIDKIISFLKDYYLYIIGGIVLITVIIVLIIVRRKRSVLE